MLRLWLLFMLLLSAAPSHAEVREQYEDLAERRGIQTEFYQRLTSEDEVTRAETGEGDGAASSSSNSVSFGGGSFATRLITGLLFGAIIIGFIILIAQNAGQLRADMAMKRKDAEAKRAKKQAPDAAEVEKRAAAYQSRSDRFAAVEDMLAEALARAEAELDLIFAESDTARELERRLRPLWDHREQLQRLVRASELSQFAGQTLSTEEYDKCLDAYRAIMGQPS